MNLKVNKSNDYLNRFRKRQSQNPMQLYDKSPGESRTRKNMPNIIEAMYEKHHPT